MLYTIITMVRAVSENDSTNTELSYLDDFADNPFWTCAAGAKHIVRFDFKTGETRKNDKGWKVLHMDIEFTSGNEGKQSGTEIPFWLRKHLLPYLRKASKLDDNRESVVLQFTRRDKEDGEKTIRSAELGEIIQA